MKKSKTWLQEHLKDPYVKLANKEGYRARSVYKLQEIVERNKIIKAGNIVIDLGAAPGSWSEYTVKLVKPRGRVVAVDLLPLSPINGVEFIMGDFTEPSVQESLKQALGVQVVDVIISDMAPNMSGNAIVDQLRSVALVESVLEFSLGILKPSGVLLVKVFQGMGFDELLKSFRKHLQVKIIKPQASRARSAEMYFLAQRRS